MPRSTRIRFSLKLLTLALLLPVITGFDSENRQPSKDVPSFELQQKTPPSPNKPELSPGTFFNLDRNEVAPAPAEPPTAGTHTALTPEKVHSWETGAHRSYLIPTLEVLGFQTLLNIYDRIVYPNEIEEGKKVYSTTFSSTWEHLRRQNWVFDKDPFNVNQFGHPYQGATVYGLARSSGLSFWESLVYSNVGSFLWEMAGETTRPSINDQITTGNAGTLLGESLFRMSQMVLENKNGARPGVWREVGAAIISPPTAFNRLVFGDRFKTVFPSYAPATFWRFRLGANLNSTSEKDATLDFAMSYGLPGKPGYTYTRPFDYFDFEIAALARASNPLESVLIRGMLYGKQYQAGNDYRGIWGLYGSYDYLSPGVFRVSSTALSLGTTGQYWLAPGMALQGTFLCGVGFGAAGINVPVGGQRDYHFGITPQGLLALRLLFGNRAAFELSGRGYYVSGTGSDDTKGSEMIARINANFNIRIYGRHGIGIQFVESFREARYGSIHDKSQSEGTVSLIYTFLGDTHYGAVEWRNPGDR